MTKQTLTEYIDENIKTLTAFGVLGAISTFFFTSFSEGESWSNTVSYILAFITLAMVTLLAWELRKKFPDEEKSDSTLSGFKALFELFFLGLVGFVMVAFSDITIMLSFFAILILGLFVYEKWNKKIQKMIRKLLTNYPKTRQLTGELTGIILVLLLFLLIFLAIEGLGLIYDWIRYALKF